MYSEFDDAHHAGVSPSQYRSTTMIGRTKDTLYIHRNTCGRAIKIIEVGGGVLLWYKHTDSEINNKTKTSFPCH